MNKRWIKGLLTTLFRLENFGNTNWFVIRKHFFSQSFYIFRYFFCLLHSSLHKKKFQIANVLLAIFDDSPGIEDRTFASLVRTCKLPLAYTGTYTEYAEAEGHKFYSSIKIWTDPFLSNATIMTFACMTHEVKIEFVARFRFEKFK